MSLRKWLGSIKKVLADEGCVVLDITQSKSHMKIHTTLPMGQKRLFVTCVTPSDNRKVYLNFRADVRRAVKHEMEK